MSLPNIKYNHLQEQYIKLLSAMENRMPFKDVAKPILLGLGLPVSNGWKQTKSKSEGYQCDEARYQKLLGKYKEHLFCGEKFVRYYDITKEDAVSLISKYKSVPLDAGDFISAYPFPLEKAQIKSSSTTKPKLVAVEDRLDGVVAVYTSIRSVEKRDSISKTTLSDSAQKDFEDYYDIIGVKQIKAQVFDVLWIPKDGGYLSVRSDILTDSVKQSEWATDQLEKVIQKDVGYNFGRPVNVFPLIKNIYLNKDEGIVVELAFNTCTASQKHEKMRKKGLCLRKEDYHRGGKNALTKDIEPYRLGVQWALGEGSSKVSKPELNVLGNSLTISNANPCLFGVTIKKCSSQSDFDLVQSKIKKYLSV